MYKSIHETELNDKIVIVGTDETASMTGRYNGFIRSLEEHLRRPLQWCVCILHTNKLLLRHVVLELDGTACSPDSFPRPIGSVLGGPVYKWPVVVFQKILNLSFPELKEMP